MANLKTFVFAAILALLPGFSVVCPITPAQAQAANSEGADQFYQRGLAADSGNGAKQDDAEAVKWYTMAADMGHREAQRNLAGMYGSGRGVPVDQDKAGKLFLAAAEAGDAQAQFAYGKWYENNKEKKARWLRLAAAQGHNEAKALLSEMGLPLTDPAATPKVAAAPDARSTAMCVQSALTKLGFDTHGVDGAIGPGTKAAFGAFATKTNLPTFFIDDANWYSPLCLHLSNLAPMDAATQATADALSANAKVIVAVAIDPEAKFSVSFEDKDFKVLGSIDKLSPGSDGRMRGEIPYQQVKNAQQMCANFADGWVVKDAQGKNYNASCDKANVALMTVEGFVLSYNVARGSVN